MSGKFSDAHHPKGRKASMKHTLIVAIVAIIVILGGFWLGTNGHDSTLAWIFLLVLLVFL